MCTACFTHCFLSIRYDNFSTCDCAGKYILGVLTHTTAWDQHWGTDETLDWVLIYVAWLCLAWYCNIHSSALPCLMEQRGLKVTRNAYFSLWTHTKHLLSVIFCNMTAGIWASFQTHRWNNGWTDRRGAWNSYLDFSVPFSLVIYRKMRESQKSPLLLLDIAIDNFYFYETVCLGFFRVRG